MVNLRTATNEEILLSAYGAGATSSITETPVGAAAVSAPERVMGQFESKRPTISSIDQT